MESTKISIGALSKATGIPVETIRTWERRYGFPNPARNAAGHREYSPAAVDQLRLIGQALDAGHRPSNVVGLPTAELNELLDITVAVANGSDDSANEDIGVRDPSNEEIRDWLVAVREFDSASLEHYFRNSWMELGALDFLAHRVHPFLFEVGAAWAERRMTVSHEHFASERLRDFLTTNWRPLSERATGPTVVLATLSGEAHSLGLQMAAVVLAVAGMRIVYLGADAPAADVAAAAIDRDAAAVVVSVSVAANRFMARRDITELRNKLPDDVDIVIGGLGAPGGLPGVKSLADLHSLAEWARGASS